MARSVEEELILNAVPSFVRYLFIIGLIIIIVVIGILLRVNYRTYYLVTGMVFSEEDSCYLKVRVRMSETNRIKTRGNLEMEGENYDYYVAKVDNVGNYLDMYLVLLSFRKEDVADHFLEVKIFEEEKKLIRVLKDYVKEEIG